MNSYLRALERVLRRANHCDREAVERIQGAIRAEKAREASHLDTHRFDRIYAQMEREALS